MRKYLIVLGLILIIGLIAGCSGSETETPAPPTNTVAPEPTQQPTPEPMGLPELETVSVSTIQNISWLWSGLIETDPSAQSVVPDPENYTLVFQEDNTYAAQADCNQVVGNFAVGEDGNITLQAGPTTLAECGPDSLYTQFLQLLGSVTGFGIQGDQLVLVANQEKAHMQFTNGGAVEQPIPTPAICAGISMESVRVDLMEIPYSYQPNCIAQSPYDGSHLPNPTGLPQHVVINFGVTNPADRKEGDPILYIVPVESYISQWEANGNSLVKDTVDSLQILLDGQTQPVPTNGLPVIPYEEVTGELDLSVQGSYLDINMGFGMRFVGRFTLAPNPVASDNPQLFYIFQGFTEDDQYLISFFYPVTTDALPVYDEVTTEELAQLEADRAGYLAQKAQELNELTASDWLPDLETLDRVIDSLEFTYEKQIKPTDQPAPTAQLTNINWQWTDLTLTDPASQSVVPDRENYVLVFFNDGRFNITADCNYGSGTYSIQGKTMTIQLGAITKVACGEKSLSDQFIALLGQVSAFDLTIPRLVLQLKDGAGNLGLANSGASVDVIPPGQDVPTAITLEPINVRSGPGTQYPSYGTVPKGTQFTVIGVSEDRAWWVVQIPTSLAASGRGWINASYCQTTGTDNVPVIPAPPLGSIPTMTPVPTSAATPTPTEEPTPYP